MKPPTLLLLALVAACEAPLHSTPPHGDTAPPDEVDAELPGDTDEDADTSEPGDDDTDEPPEEQRFEHTCTGAASYVHTFPLQMSWGDSKPEMLFHWVEDHDGRMYRSNAIEMDADGRAVARCGWMPPLNGEPGYQVTTRHLLIVK